MLIVIRKLKKIPPYLNNTTFFNHLIEQKKILNVIEFIKKGSYFYDIFIDVAINDHDYEKRFNVYCKLLCRTEIGDLLSRKNIDKSKILELTIIHKLYDSQKILSLLDPSEKTKISNIINTGKMLKLTNQDIHKMIVSEYENTADLSILKDIELS